MRCDFFPAYDEDGGMLASIAPGGPVSSPPRSCSRAALAGPAAGAADAGLRTPSRPSYSLQLSRATPPARTGAGRQVSS